MSKQHISIVARGRDRNYVFRVYGTTVESIFTELSRVSGKDKDDFALFYDGVELEKGFQLARYNIHGSCDIFILETEYILSHQSIWKDFVTLNKLCVRIQSTRSVQTNDQSLVTDILQSLFAKFVVDADDSELIQDYIHMFQCLGILKILCKIYKSAPTNTAISLLARNAIGVMVDSTLQLPSSVSTHIVPDIIQLLGYLSGTELSKKCRRGFVQLLGSFIDLDRHHRVWQSVTLAKLCSIVENYGNELESAVTKLAYPSSTRFNLKNADGFPHLINIVVRLCQWAIPLPVPLPAHLPESYPLRKELLSLHKMFQSLLPKVDLCLDSLAVHYGGHAVQASDFLHILKALYHISHIFVNATEKLEIALKKNMRVLRILVIQFTLEGDSEVESHSWLLALKKSLGFLCRSHLVMNLFRKRGNNAAAAAAAAISINRAELLNSSVQAINQASLENLQQGMSIMFVGEDAEGPGVLKEWMFLVIKNLFAPENGQPRLFITNEEDRKTFYLNSRFTIENGQRDYFHFFGRMLGLALKYRIRISVRFHQVLFAQFAGNEVTLEDIKTADPAFYKSWKEMVEMSPAELRDTLGLDVEEDSEKAVMKIVHDQFMDPNCLEVKEMCKGFEDIIGSRERQALFFQFLTIDDLNKMLGVSTDPLPVDEWRKHTDYVGYVDTDPQIEWFWKIVSEMPENRSRLLLYFWTSTEYLPLNGFAGLDARFKIEKVAYVDRTLPTSHTCFFRIDIPEYPSFDIMKECMERIVAGDLDFGFGFI